MPLSAGCLSCEGPIVTFVRPPCRLLTIAQPDRAAAHHHKAISVLSCPQLPTVGSPELRPLKQDSERCERGIAALLTPVRHCRCASCILQIMTLLCAEWQEVGRLGAGMCFGELALLSSEPRPATVKAVSNTDLLALSRTDFQRLLGPLQNLLTDHAAKYCPTTTVSQVPAWSCCLMIHAMLLCWPILAIVGLALQNCLPSLVLGRGRMGLGSQPWVLLP